MKKNLEIINIGKDLRKVTDSVLERIGKDNFAVVIIQDGEDYRLLDTRDHLEVQNYLESCLSVDAQKTTELHQEHKDISFLIMGQMEREGEKYVCKHVAGITLKDSKDNVASAFLYEGPLIIPYQGYRHMYGL